MYLGHAVTESIDVDVCKEKGEDGKCLICSEGYDLDESGVCLKCDQLS
jgi:hypothetical protein